MVCRHFSHAIYFEDAVAVVHLMDRYSPSSTLAIIDEFAVFFCICEQRDKKIARHGPSQQQYRTDRQAYGWQLKTATGVWMDQQQHRPQGDVGPGQDLHCEFRAQ